MFKKNWKTTTLIIFVLITLIRENTNFDFNLNFQNYTVNLWGGVPKCSLKSDTFSTELTYKGYKTVANQQNTEKLYIRIREFNAYSPALYIPLFKPYSPEILADVYNGQNTKVGEVLFKGDIYMFGFCSRNMIIKKTMKHASKKINEYLLDRTCKTKKKAYWANRRLSKVVLKPRVMTESKFGVNFPFRLYNFLEEFSQGEYFLRSSSSNWTDTIYFEHYYSSIDSLVGYETCSFNYNTKQITQRRYFNDHTLFLEGWYNGNKLDLWALRDSLATKDYFSNVSMIPDSAKLFDHGNPFLIYYQNGETKILDESRINQDFFLNTLSPKSQQDYDIGRNYVLDLNGIED